MSILRNRFWLASIAIAVVSLATVVAQQQLAVAGPFTAAQAVAGATAYQASCASCHQPDLRGQGTATPLAGTEFLGAWGGRSAGDLLSFIRGEAGRFFEFDVGDRADDRDERKSEKKRAVFHISVG